MADIRSFFGGGKPKTNIPTSPIVATKKEDKVDEKENNELKSVDVATIIDKQGSSPRYVISSLLIGSHGY